MKKSMIAISVATLLLSGCTISPKVEPIDTVVAVQSDINAQEAKAILDNSILKIIPILDGRLAPVSIDVSRSNNRDLKGTVINYELTKKYLFSIDVGYYYNEETHSVDREAFNTKRYKGYNDYAPWALMEKLPVLDEFVVEKVTNDYQNYVEDRTKLLSAPYTLSPQVEMLMDKSDKQKFAALFTQENVNTSFLDYYDYNYKGQSLLNDYVMSEVKSLTAKNFSGINVMINQNNVVEFISASFLAKPNGWVLNNKDLQVTALNYKYEISNLTDKFITIDRAASYVNSSVNKDEIDLPLEIPPKSKMTVSHKGKNSHYRVTALKPDQSVDFSLSFEYSIEGKKKTLNGQKTFKPLI